MTIEAKLDELIELTKQLVAADGTPAKAKAKGDDEDVKPAPKKRGPKPKAAKAPTVAAMKKAAVDFLEQAGDDEDEYVERKSFVKEVIAEYGVGKFSEIETSDRLDALAKLDDYGSGDEKDDDDIA